MPYISGANNRLLLGVYVNKLFLNMCFKLNDAFKYSHLEVKHLIFDMTFITLI